MLVMFFRLFLCLNSEVYLKSYLLKIFKNETISYLFFGVLTTVVNYATFIFSLHFLGNDMPLVANVISYVTATLFAYITNKIWVFHSNNWSFNTLIYEFFTFFTSRLFSFSIEQLGLFLCIETLNVSQYTILKLNGVVICKVALSFVAVIINYFISKLFIFKKKN